MRNKAKQVKSNAAIVKDEVDSWLSGMRKSQIFLSSTSNDFDSLRELIRASLHSVGSDQNSLNEAGSSANLLPIATPKLSSTSQSLVSITRKYFPLRTKRSKAITTYICSGKSREGKSRLWLSTEISDRDGSKDRFSSDGFEAHKHLTNVKAWVIQGKDLREASICNWTLDCAITENAVFVDELSIDEFTSPRDLCVEIMVFGCLFTEVDLYCHHNIQQSIFSNGFRYEGLKFAQSSADGSNFDQVLDFNDSYTVYLSDDSGQVPGVTNIASDIFVYDRISSSVTQISHATNGTQSNRDSSNPGLSVDGRYIAFSSLASNLVAGDNNTLSDFIDVETLAGVIERINFTNALTEANGINGYDVSSAEGLVIGPNIVYQTVAGATRKYCITRVAKLIVADRTDYEELGNVTGTTASDLRTAVYAYDLLTRLTRVEYPDGRKVDYTYDVAGNLLSMRDFTGWQFLTYDTGDRLTSVSYSPTNNSNDPAALRIGYEYGLTDRLTALTYSSGKRVECGYTLAGRLNRVTETNTGKVDLVITYTYSSIMGLLTEMTRLNDMDTTYGCNSSGPLNDNYQRPTSAQASVLWYACTRDATGVAETTESGVRAKKYVDDYFYRMSEATYSEENGTIDGRVVRCGYDKSCRLLAHTTFDNVVFAGATETLTHTSDFENRLLMASKKVQEITLTLTKEFTYGSSADAPGNAKSYAVASYVIFGGASLSTTIDLATRGTAGITIFGANANDQSGWSVSGAGDVNWDGFDDLLIGARYADALGNSRNQSCDSYLVFGDNFTAAITHLGTAAGETLTGTSTANVMIGGRGNDTLVGGGGADVLTGEQGNDVLGGTGGNTLRLDDSGLSLNLTKLPDNRVLGIKQIDITSNSKYSLKLNQREVRNLSDESNTLVVQRNAGDDVNILDLGCCTPNSCIPVVVAKSTANSVPNQRPVCIANWCFHASFESYFHKCGITRVDEETNAATEASSSETHCHYEACGNLTHFIAPQGRVTQFFYDSRPSVAPIIHISNSESRYGFDTVGKTETMFNPLERVVDYFPLSGTSMATPIKSTVAALTLLKAPGLTLDRVKAHLMKTATKYKVDLSVGTIRGWAFDSNEPLEKVPIVFFDGCVSLPDWNRSHEQNLFGFIVQPNEEFLATVENSCNQCYGSHEGRIFSLLPFVGSGCSMGIGLPFFPKCFAVNVLWRTHCGEEENFSFFETIWRVTLSCFEVPNEHQPQHIRYLEEYITQTSWRLKEMGAKNLRKLLVEGLERRDLNSADTVSFIVTVVPDGTPIVSEDGMERKSDFIERMDSIYGSDQLPMDEKPWFKVIQDRIRLIQEAVGVPISFSWNDSSSLLGGSTNSAPTYIRIGGFSMDGNRGKLGEHRQYTGDKESGSWVFIDSWDPYFNDTSKESLGLGNVVTHEILHGLGLGHSSGQLSIMNPVLSREFSGAQPIDVYQLQIKLGDPSELSEVDVSNEKPFSGVVANDADKDKFVFTAKTTGLVRVRVSPLELVEYSGRLSDLSLIVGEVDSQERTTWDAKGLGEAEEFLLRVVAGKKYTVAVAAKGKGNQPYTLNLNYDPKAQTDQNLQATTTLDSSSVLIASEDVSLRKAIEIANAQWPAPVNIFLKAGEYAVSDGEFSIANNITITGVSTETTKLDAKKLSRVFSVGIGGSLTLRNLTLTGGFVDGDDEGGAIALYMSDLFLDNVNINNCFAAHGGGAIKSFMGKLQIDNSRIENNRTNQGGGGISAFMTEQNIEKSVFENNQARYGGAIYSIAHLTIKESIFRSNIATELGGGVSQQGGYIFKMTDSIVEKNKANYGAGLDLGNGFSEIENNSIRNNVAAVSGGGIRISDIGSLTMRTSFVVANRAHSGAGIFNSEKSSLAVYDSEVDSNVATEFGGGIASSGGTTIERSSIIGNHAENYFGGGVFLDGSAIGRLENCTISDNLSNNGGAGIASQVSGIVSINHCTIIGNTQTGTSSADGSGINNHSDNVIFTLQNSIVAQNGLADNAFDLSGSVLSRGGNVIGIFDPANARSPGFDRFGTKGAPLDPILRSFLPNGGPTRTYALLSSSPAIDFANSSSSTTDQRNVSRVSDGNFDGIPAPDSGAFELEDNTRVFAYLRGDYYISPANLPAFDLNVAYWGGIIDPKTFDDRDLTVIGPSGTVLKTEFFSATKTDYGYLVGYRVYATKGSWQTDDRGDFTVKINEGSVALVGGTSIQGATIGQARVVFDANYQIPEVGKLTGPKSVVQGESIQLLATDIHWGNSTEREVSFGRRSVDGETDSVFLSDDGSWHNCSASSGCFEASTNSWKADFDTSTLQPGMHEFFAVASGSSSTRKVKSIFIEVLPRISISNAEVREPQLGTSRLVFEITSMPSPSRQTIYLSTLELPGGATSVTDFIPLRRMPVVIEAGVTKARVSIAVLSDRIDENSELLSLVATDSQGTQISNTAFGTILDDSDAIFGRKITSVDTVSEGGGTVVEVDTPNPPTFPWFGWWFGESATKVQPLPNVNGGPLRFSVPTPNNANVFGISGTDETTLVINQVVSPITTKISMSARGDVAIIEFGGVLTSAMGADIFYVSRGASLILNDAGGKTIFAESGSRIRYSKGSPTIFAEQGADLPKNASNVIATARIQVAVNTVSRRTLTPPHGNPTNLEGVFEVEAVYADKVFTEGSSLDVDGDGVTSPLDVLSLINIINSGTEIDINANKRKDVDEDGRITPLDVLVLINEINRLGGHGEGESIEGNSQLDVIHVTHSGWDIDSVTAVRRKKQP